MLLPYVGPFSVPIYDDGDGTSIIARFLITITWYVSGEMVAYGRVKSHK